nr:hypothetical protein [uncultured Mediterraneibacter sp.]
MSISSEELEKRIRRQKRHARANANIIALSAEVTQYEIARRSVESAKNSCETEKNNWETVVNSLSAKEITRTEIFEGEMAQKLTEYRQEAVNENNDGIQAAGDLADSLSSQITMIDNKISDLKSSISYWQSQLY